VNSPASDENASVNKVVATTLAARVAETANLPVAANVANLSVSLAAKSEVASTSGTESVEKQEIVQPNNSRRELISHKVKAGETADTIAQQYGVSKDTIKWANNLTGDTLTVGKELVVPPVDGVVYTVKDNDTVASLTTLSFRVLQRI
jgi:LysM repeat protein